MTLENIVGKGEIAQIENFPFSNNDFFPHQMNIFLFHYHFNRLLQSLSILNKKLFVSLVKG